MWTLLGLGDRHAVRFWSRIALLVLLVAGSITARSAGGEIFQQAFVQAPPVGDNQMVNDGGTGVITQDITAMLSSPDNYSLVASVGRFGAVGLSATSFPGSSPNNFQALVGVSNDEFVNRTGVAQHALLKVIVDGGMMQLVPGPSGSGAESVAYDYTLTSLIHPLGNPGSGFGKMDFISKGSLQPDVNGILTFTTVESGAQLGATFDPTTATVTIPLSFQTFDLGVLPPNDTLQLVYIFSFQLVNDGTAFMTASYSDPFQLSTNPALGTVTFQPAAVPEPCGLVLLGSGGLAVLVFRRRRSANLNVTDSKRTDNRARVVTSSILRLPKR